MSNFINTSDYRIPVEFYSNPSFCENLSLLTSDNVVEVFGGLCIALEGIDQVAAAARFKSLDITFVEAQNTQNVFFDRMAPYIFIYIFTAFPRNHTDAFFTYQGNKAKGFLRLADKFKMMYQAEDLIINRGALEELRSFLDSHSEFCKFACQIYLGYLNANTQNAVKMYAVELKPAIDYTYLIGVKMIKEEIIDKNHPIQHNFAVARGLQYYMQFVAHAQRRFGEYWTFVALMDKDAWLSISRESHFTELWILAGILGIEGNPGYAKLTVNNKTIAQYSTEPAYSKVIRMYSTAAQNVAVHLNYQNQSTSDRINSYVQGWTRNDDESTIGADLNSVHIA